MAKPMILKPGTTREFEQIVKAHWRLDAFKRFQCVWLGQVLHLGVEEIAHALQLHVSTVRRIQASYEQEGSSAIEGHGNRGGRRRNYLDIDEEAAFLKAYARRIQRGRICTISELKTAFEARVGAKVNKTTIYRLLERHGWGAPLTRLHQAPVQDDDPAQAAI